MGTGKVHMHQATQACAAICGGHGPGPGPGGQGEGGGRAGIGHKQTKAQSRKVSPRAATSKDRAGKDEDKER